MVSNLTNKAAGHQYTLGLRYQPAEALALRVSHAKGVLPPSPSQLVPVAFPGFPGTVDPKRGNTTLVSAGGWIIQGNPDLEPEQSSSWSAGAIFTPSRLPGLRLSADYTRISKTDEIAGLTSYRDLVLERDELFPGRVVRAELTPADAQLGYTGGEIQLFDLSNFNLASTRVEAWDFQADYSWQTALGTFSANLIATHATEYAVQVVSTIPVAEYVDYALSGGPLGWRGNGGLTWERNAWAASWNMQYYGSYWAYTVTASPAATALSQGSETIPRQSYHDLFFRYRFDETMGFARGFLAGSEVSFGVANVLDTSAPLVAVSSPTDGVGGGGYSKFADPRGRRFSLSWRKSFQ